MIRHYDYTQYNFVIANPVWGPRDPRKKPGGPSQKPPARSRTGPHTGKNRPPQGVQKSTTKGLKGKKQWALQPLARSKKGPHKGSEVPQQGALAAGPLDICKELQGPPQGVRRAARPEWCTKHSVLEKNCITFFIILGA